MFLVLVKSYRDDSVYFEELKKTGKLFHDQSNAETYRMAAGFQGAAIGKEVERRETEKFRILV